MCARDLDDGRLGDLVIRGDVAPVASRSDVGQDFPPAIVSVTVSHVFVHQRNLNVGEYQNKAASMQCQGVVSIFLECGEILLVVL